MENYNLLSDAIKLVIKKMYFMCILNVQGGKILSKWFIVVLRMKFLKCDLYYTAGNVIKLTYIYIKITIL